MKEAVSYENKTGISGLNLSPRNLMMRIKVLQRDEKLKQIQLAEAFIVANSEDKKVWEEFVRNV